MVEDERRVAGWQSWMTVRALAANRSGWKENVKALCALWHEEIESKRLGTRSPYLSEYSKIDESGNF